MTERQDKFIDIYSKTGNATQSAIEAGYSEKTAKQKGYELKNLLRSSGSSISGVSPRFRLYICEKQEPPIRFWPSPRSINNKMLSFMFFNCGVMTLLTSSTGENAEMTSDNGAVLMNLFSSLVHEVCIESESLPTGIVIPILLQKSTEIASTVS